MLEFIINNWLSILSILIGLLVSYVFYRLQKRDVVSATEERLKRAREELLDTLESITINKQQLTEVGILNLLAASERAYSVQLQSTCTPISLLQDVSLRLQRSRHLDVNQKNEYALGIEGMIQAISDSQRSTPASLTSSLRILEQLQSSLAMGDAKSASQLAVELRKDIEQSRSSPAPETSRDVSEKVQVLLSGSAGLLAALASLFSLRDFDVLKALNDSTVSAIVALSIGLGGITTLIVIRQAMRRKQESRQAASAVRAN